LYQVWLILAAWFWRRFKKNITHLLLSPLEETHSPSFDQSPSPKDNLYQVWLILAGWIWRRFLIFFFYSFAIISLWKKAFSFIWSNLNSSPTPQKSFVPSLVQIGPVVLKKIFKWPNPTFTFFYYRPFEEDLADYLNNLNPLYPRIICTKFDWFWPVGSGEEDFKKKFSVFLRLSPLW
jgi:hypothetical protein